MLTEIALLQRFSVFLGHPIYSLSVCLFSLILSCDVARYGSFFGPISTVITLLVFLHLASMAVLLGAEVARANVLEDDEDRGPTGLLSGRV